MDCTLSYFVRKCPIQNVQSLHVCIINSYAYYYWWCNCARDLYMKRSMCLCVWFVLSSLFKSAVLLLQLMLLLCGISCSVFSVCMCMRFVYLSSSQYAMCSLWACQCDCFALRREEGEERMASKGDWVEGRKEKGIDSVMQMIVTIYIT